MPIELRTPVDPETSAAIERIVASQPTLEEVVRWVLGQKGRTARDFDVIVQDEYTHDVVVPWNVSAGPGDTTRRLFLVYDTT